VSFFFFFLFSFFSFFFFSFFFFLFFSFFIFFSFFFFFFFFSWSLKVKNIPAVALPLVHGAPFPKRYFPFPPAEPRVAKKTKLPPARRLPPLFSFYSGQYFLLNAAVREYVTEGGEPVS